MNQIQKRHIEILEGFAKEARAHAKRLRLLADHLGQRDITLRQIEAEELTAKVYDQMVADATETWTK